MIHLDNVHLTLPSAAGPVNILNGIDLNVAAGEMLGVVGPSGSGKSTLMMMIAGLERPSGGAVAVDGVNFAGLDEDRLAAFRRDRMGIVFQSFHLIPTMTALENVAIPLEFAGHRNAFAVAEAALGEVGLKPRLHHYPAQLSGGEQQRVAIARAFISRPRLVLADEPTGNLDQETGRGVIDLLYGLNREAGTTFVLITHDPSLAAGCSRIAHLAGGRIVEMREGAPAPALAAGR